MGDISEHFDRSEFRCKCGHCGFEAADKELVETLEAVRAHYNEVLDEEIILVIHSGCR